MDFGLIGERLGYSHSKKIHGMLADYDYELRSIPRDEVDSFVAARDYKGLNVTIPYKLTVMKHCDEITPSARAIGSVNTLIVRDGKLIGDNTDMAGFASLARRAGDPISGAKVLVLGSGGTSRTVRAVASEMRARETIVVSRSPSREGEISYEEAASDHRDADVVINATPSGTSPDIFSSAMSLAPFEDLRCVLDVVYNPLRSAICLEAARMGVPAFGGLRMLVAQAKFAAEHFSGASIGDDRIDEIEHDLRRDLSNIVLIGMTGSGKSSIGSAVAKLLGRPMIDLDREIERREGESPKKIFASKGEGAMRDAESRAIAAESLVAGRVISTGGGAVIRESNARALAANGIIVRVKRDIARTETEGRPLFGGRTIEEIAREREPFYRAAADAEIENASSIEDAAKKVIDAWERKLKEM